MDRTQVWTILADFQSLTKESRAAARAVRELDDARTKAAANNKRAIVDTGEVDRIEELNTALTSLVQTRRQDSRAIRANTKAATQAATSHQQLASGVRGANSSLLSHSQANGKASSSSRNAASASANQARALSRLGAAARSSSNDNNNLTSSTARLSGAARGATHQTSALARAIQDIVPVSKSWAFFMKMLPLTAVTSAINSLLPAVMSLGAGFIGLMGTLGPLAGLLGGLPAMLAGVGGAAGGLIAGLGGITKAVAAHTKMTEAQAKASRKEARATTSSAKAAESASRTREKALRNHDRSVRNNARSQEKARRDQVRAARDVQDAEANIGEVAAENAQRLSRAQRTVVESQKSVAAAQRGVTEARRDAERALKDYQSRLRGATLDEESATISLQESRAALARILADPGSTSLEKKSAQNAVRQAELSLRETRESNSDLEKEAAEAQARGIEGSEQVSAALQDEQSARQGLADAQQAVTETQKDNAKASEQAARSLADAQQSYVDSGERIRDLQEDLVDINETLQDSLEAAAAASAAAGDTAAGAATQVDEFNAAMESLGPNAREVVYKLLEISEAWKKISSRAQEAISPGLLSFLNDLKDDLLPPIGDFLVRMAGGAGDFADRLGKVLTKRKSLENLNLIFEDAYDFMTLMGNATLNVTEWILGLGAAARKSGLTTYIGEVIEGWTEGWKNSVTTPEGIERTVDSLEKAQHYASLWGGAIRETWGFLGSLFRGFQPLGTWVLENIRDTTKAWKEWIESPSGRDKFEVWTRLSKINLSGLTDSIGMIGKMIDRSLTDPKMEAGIKKFWDALNGDGQDRGFIEAMGDLLSTVTPDAITSVIDMGTALMDILKILGESGGREAVESLLEGFASLTEMFSGALKTLPGLSTALLGFMGIMASKKMLVALGSLTGITPMVHAVGAAKAKGYSRGNGLGVAATREYMGYGNFNIDRTTDSGQYLIAQREAKQQARNARRNSRVSVAESSKVATRQTKIKTAVGIPTAGTSPSALGAVLSTNTALKTQAGLVGGVTRAAGGLSAVFKGILGFLGPIGAAFIAWQGFSALAQHLSTAVPDLEAAQAAMEGMVKSASGIDQINTLFKDAKDPTRELTSGVSDLDSALQFARDLDSSGLKRFERDVENVFGAMLGVQGDAAKVEQAFEQLDVAFTSMSYEDAVTAFNRIAEGSDLANVSADELARRFPGYAESLRTALRDASNEFQSFSTDNQTVARLMRGEVVDGLKVYEGELISVKEANERAKPSVEELNSALQEQKDKALDTARAQQENIDAVRDLNRLQRDATDTRLRAQSAEDEYLSTLSSLNEEIKDNGTSLDANSEKGRLNRQVLRDLAQTALDNADAMYANGASADVVNDRMTTMRDDVLKKLQTEFNLTADQAAAYATELGLIPNYVNTEVLISVDNSAEKARLIEEQLGLLTKDLDLKRELRIIAMTEGFDAAQAAIDSLMGVKASQNLTKRSIFTGKSAVTARATGGPVFGEGTATSDSIPAYLSDGEYVIRTKAARSLGYDTLDHLNKKGSLPGYATGGKVRKFARGGAAKSTGGTLGTIVEMTLQFGDLTRSVQPAVREVEALASLGNRLRGPISEVENMIGRVTTSVLDLGRMARIELGVPWTQTWVRAKSTALAQMQALVMGMIPIATAMSQAWTNVMNTMKQPIRLGIGFVNNTLGTLVNTVSNFYGVRKTPFPVKIEGFDGGGWTGPGARLQPAGIVHADEYVIKKDSRQQIERNNPGALDYMNRTGRFPGYAVGGRVRPVAGPESRNYSGHSGVDYRIPSGTAVKAAGSGTISALNRWGHSYGLHIVQSLGNGLRAIYAHLSGFNTTRGASVGAGQVIGYSGNTGNSTGPHLHFEVAPSRTGLPSNRAYTRAWLGGAVHGAPGEGSTSAHTQVVDPAAAAALANLTSMVKSPSGALAGLNRGMNQTGWGSIVGASVAQMAHLALGNVNKLSAQAADVVSAAASGNFGSGTQRDNAFGIIDIAMKRGLGHRGALLGLMTAMQESSLINLRGGDRDSVGLFQQRPSQGWGSVAQIMNPTYSANKFFDGLMRLKSWRDGPEWEDIQAVQISAFPRAYQKHKTRALAYLNDWAAARGQAFAGGGWTGPGSKNRPAGIVHADEYVIQKSSRRRLEQTAPGLLDHLNNTGQIPGYASGGKVADPKKYTVPRTLKNFKPYLAYLQAAQDADSNSSLLPKNSETKQHVQFIENMLAFEGYLSRKDADGRWTGADTEAWKKWQTRVGEPDTGQVDYAAFGKLMRWYKLPYDNTTPFVKGYTQPSRLDAVTGAQVASNKQMTEYMNLLNKLRAWGLSETFNSLKDLGPNGIPEEYRDSANPLTGMEMARAFAKNSASARRHEAALKEAAKFEKSESAAAKAMSEMIDLVTWGLDGPYGLTTLASELGLSIDTTASMFKKALATGGLKNVASSRTSRLRKEVVDFDNLFRFSKGGIVPGVGDRDTVMALLTPGELVVPKDLVNSAFASTQTVTPFLDLSNRVSSRSDNASAAESRSTVFNTNIYNPVAEESSVSVQKRVRNIANLGLLGR